MTWIEADHTLGGSSCAPASGGGLTAETSSGGGGATPLPSRPPLRSLSVTVGQRAMRFCKSSRRADWVKLPVLGRSCRYRGQPSSSPLCTRGLDRGRRHPSSGRRRPADLAPSTRAVARTIASLAVPVVTGIGHETDRSSLSGRAAAARPTPRRRPRRYALVAHDRRQGRAAIAARASRLERGHARSDRWPLRTPRRPAPLDRGLLLSSVRPLARSRRGRAHPATSDRVPRTGAGAAASTGQAARRAPPQRRLVKMHRALRPRRRARRLVGGSPRLPAACWPGFVDHPDHVVSHGLSVATCARAH